ncbi:hypothetical protein [Salinibacter ruber]|nr:hypothetical protein [Salinibacter ruber]
MWESVLGAVVGALVGGGITYYIQRRLEKQRKQENALRELWKKSIDLKADYLRLLRDPGSERKREIRSRIHEVASEMELLATKIAEEDFKRTVLEVLHGEYDNPLCLGASILKLEDALEAKAFPTLHDVTAKSQEKLVEEILPSENSKLRGPADDNFIWNRWDSDELKDIAEEKVLEDTDN